MVKVLFATRVNQPDWEEQLITEYEERIPAAIEWAKNNGFDRIRIAVLDMSIKPDFSKTLTTNSKKGV